LGFNLVASILKEWDVEKWVERNLIELHLRNRMRIMNDRKIVADIAAKIKP
jgi:hypothetical protein